MLKTLETGQAIRLKAFLREAGFTAEGVRNRIRTNLMPGRHLQNLPLLLHRTQALDPLDILIRWFVVGEPVPLAVAKKVIPIDVLDLLAKCGLFSGADEKTKGSVMFAPFEKFWIATDTYERLSKGSGQDDVLMVNGTTIILLNLAIRTPARSLLDLGTGCGVVSLAASRFADQVTGTDLNGRAATLARFNAWLNETSNVEILAGNLFEPVRGRRFERILSNPPFYVTPTSDRLFAENPMELDGFCRMIVKQAPDYLEEGGFLQMLFEWPEIEGESWQERVAEWFQGTGCDAVVWTGGAHDPVLYTEARLPVVTAPSGRDADCRKFEEWVDFYKAKKVKTIHSGFLTMRRRSGQNWVHFEPYGSEVALPSGDAILRRFELRDHPRSDRDLLRSKIQVAEGVQLRQVLEFRDQQWSRSDNVQMVQTTGLQLVHNLTPEVAEFVAKLDGSTPLTELVDSLAREAPAPREKVEGECLSLVRKLVDRDFLREVQ